MPFVFSGQAFTGPQPSPLGQFLTSMFGSAAQEVPKAFQDAREDARFQQQLGLRMQEFDWQKHQDDLRQQNYLGEKAQQQQERTSQATMLAPGIDGGPRIGNTLPATAAFLAQHNARTLAYKQILSGMEPRDQDALKNILVQQEERSKMDAYRKDVGGLLQNRLRALQMDTGGPVGASGPVQPDPLYENAKQQHMALLQGLQQGLASGVGDPQAALKAVTEGDISLRQMKEAHHRNQAMLQAYSAISDQTHQQWLNMVAGPGHDTSHPSHTEYTDYLQDKFNRQQALLQDLQENPDMDPKEFRLNWDKIENTYRPKMIEGAQNADQDQAIKHAQAQLEYLNKRQTALRENVTAGLTKPEDAQAQMQSLQQEERTLMETINQLSQPQGQQSAGPEQAMQGPPTSGPITPQPVTAGVDVNKLADAVSAGKEREFLASQKGVVAPEEMARARALAERQSASRQQRFARSGMGAAENYVSPETDVLKEMKGVNLEEPKDEGDWNVQMRFLENQAKRTAQRRYAAAQAGDDQLETHWHAAQNTLEAQIKAMRKYGTLKQYRALNAGELDKYLGAKPGG